MTITTLVHGSTRIELVVVGMGTGRTRAVVHHGYAPHVRMLRVAPKCLWHALTPDKLGILINDIVQRLSRTSQQGLLIHHHHVCVLLAVADAIVMSIAVAIGIVSSGVAIAVVHRGQPGRRPHRCSPLGRGSWWLVNRSGAARGRR